MSSPSSVGVDDDLTSSETSISLGSSDGEGTARVQVEDGVFIEKVSGKDSHGDLVLQLAAKIVKRDFRPVLGRNDNSVDSLGKASSSIKTVLNGDLEETGIQIFSTTYLSLTVGTNPWELFVTTKLMELVVELIEQGFKVRG